MKWVYDFSETNQTMTHLVGGKGANLGEMLSLGIPVPQGFTLTTQACNAHLKGELGPQDLAAALKVAMQRLENKVNKGFGSQDRPLFVSVRSGAPVSMPGMMDTILNLGFNKTVVKAFGHQVGMHFAYTCYGRLVQMFADVVWGAHKQAFDHATQVFIKAHQVSSFDDLPQDLLQSWMDQHLALYEKHVGQPFPQDVYEQLLQATLAVFRSWNNDRAIVYRNHQGIDHTIGTAVNIQEMVFGNFDAQSGTGVVFTRNPSTGAPDLYGEVLMRAQGEDVVAGIRTPQPIQSLSETSPQVYDSLLNTCKTLEAHYKDMQDIEFTIESGKLYLLQTRNGKRAPQSELRILHDLVTEGLISREQAILRVKAQQVERALHKSFTPGAKAETQAITKGLPASPGAAVGRIYFSSDQCKVHSQQGEKVILVRPETSPEDIEGMLVSEGILTATGGMTSHAAVVARSLGKPCVAGCQSAYVDLHAKKMQVGDWVVYEGDIISIDGSTGQVYSQALDIDVGETDAFLSTLIGWCQSVSAIDVYTNADRAQDVAVALNFGAHGVGLCRTEHMFFEEDRIGHMQHMIMAKTQEDRVKALARLKPFQVDDFKALFTTLKGLPLVVRLLDPPLHEFLDHDDPHRDKLVEVNPMLGHRGCRLAITYPEVYDMQVEAIFEAALAMGDLPVAVKIMVPLVGFEEELVLIKNRIQSLAKRLDPQGLIAYEVGTMIEVPRAALTAYDIAKHADFFSFGTNDLTQMTLGFSRDDASKFIPDYMAKGIFEKDPFERLDQKGVGLLVDMAAKEGRRQKAHLSLGLCGEHGGEETSIAFALKVGLDYVSCSPYRVPVAWLSAAKASLLR